MLAARRCTPGGSQLCLSRLSVGVILLRFHKRSELAHTDAVVVLTTIATSDEAVTLIRELLDRRLIACGTVLPQSRSLYRWEGKVADETEAVLLLKTRSGCVEGLRRAFAELHPYKVPELLAIPVTGGLERYLGWINSETSLTIA